MVAVEWTQNALAAWGISAPGVKGLAGLAPPARFVEDLGSSIPDDRPDDTESQRTSCSGLTPIMRAEHKIRLHAFREQ